MQQNVRKVMQNAAALQENYRGHTERHCRQKIIGYVRVLEEAFTTGESVCVCMFGGACSFVCACVHWCARAFVCVRSGPCVRTRVHACAYSCMRACVRVRVRVRVRVT